MVCTIHQPSSQVFAMFDRVLLMAEGRVAFLGDTSAAVTFFESIHLPCPYNFNPADHYIHVLAVTPGRESECRQTIHHVCDTFQGSPLGVDVQQQVENQMQQENQDAATLAALTHKKKSPYKASWMAQFKATLRRSLLAVIKEPLIMQVRIFQTIVSFMPFPLSDFLHF